MATEQEWRDSVTTGLAEIKTEQRIFRELMLDHVKTDKEEFARIHRERAQDNGSVTVRLDETGEKVTYMKGGIAALLAAMSIFGIVWGVLHYV